MSMGGGSSITEKLEHSTILDLVSVGVYAYFGFVAYNNLGYNKGQIFGVSTDPTVIAVQLAGVLILINLIFILHDKVGGDSGGIH